MASAPVRFYNRCMDGLVWLYNKVSVRTAAVVSLVAPVLLFFKDFASATIALVGQTFGNSGSDGVTDILFNSFNRVTGFDFSWANTMFQTLNSQQNVNVGYFFRLFRFDEIVDLVSWYLASLLVVWFLRFVWTSFKFVISHLLSSLPV